MVETTKTQSESSISVVEPLYSRRYKFLEYLLSKGYALGNDDNVRYYSPNISKIADYPHGVVSILKDKTEKSKKQAARLPIVRLFRERADAIARFTFAHDKEYHTTDQLWFYVLGDNNIEEVKKLAEEISSKYKFRIEIRSFPENESELFFHKGGQILVPMGY
jgi:hypothetical protein